MMASNFDLNGPAVSDPQTAEEVKQLNAKQLNAVLRRHGKSTTGKREHKIRILCDVLQLDFKKTDFQKVLANVRNTKQGWTKDMRQCPAVSLYEVTDYLLRSHDTVTHTDSGNLESFYVQNLERYKTLRSYELYRSGHIHSMMFQTMVNTDYCALRGKCNPSWDTSGTVYDCIVIFEEGGQPVGSSCTCTAGLGEACTHVAAMLFAVEDFTSLGHHMLPNDPASTELLCAWNAPKKPKVEPVPLNKLVYQCRGPEKSKADVSDDRKYAKKRLASHNPVNPKKRGVDPESYKRLVHVLNLCQPDAPFCTIADPQKWEAVPVNNPELVTYSVLAPVIPGDSPALLPSSEVTVSTSASEPLNIISKGVQFMYLQSSDLVTDDLVEDFVSSLLITNSEQEAIELITRGQSQNPKWKAFRKGMITSSNIHAIHAQVKSIKANQAQDADRLVAVTLGTGKPFVGNEDTRYGITHEKHAAKVYCCIMKQRHVNFELTECGLQLLKTHPYIGSSADRIAKCSCHPQVWPVEIKCPSSMQHKPRGSYPELSCISQENNVLTLKCKPVTHPYFTQVQCHMAVMGSSVCDFVIWSPQKTLILQVDFDSNYWSSVLSNAIYFFQNFVAPEILHMNHKPHAKVQCERDDFVKQYVCGNKECRSLLVDAENLNDNVDASVMCECSCGCGVWHHWHCSSLSQLDVEVSDKLPKWFCPVCESSCNSQSEE